MNGESLDIQKANLEKLRALFPEVFSENQIDLEKLKAVFTNDINFSNERYVLNWAGKSDAFKTLQLATTATLNPCPDESINFDTTENVFIEGENLEVLKILQKSYHGKIKVISIDPPYNTGSDSFVYPDKFSEKKEDYLKRIGDKDENGNLLKDDLLRKNSKDNGQFHSNWLNMMFPRLFLAKNLLRDDGVIFVHIDDTEVHNLRLLMNEIFGEENFIDCIIWKKRYGGGAKEKYLVSVHEYALVYARNITNLNPIYIPNNQESIERYYIKKDLHFEVRGGYRTHPLEATKSMGERKNLVFPIFAPDGTEVWPQRQWLWSRERVADALTKDELDFLKDKTGKWSVHTKQYLKDTSGKEREIKAFSIIDNVFTQHGTNEMLELFNNAQIFPFSKPTGLIKQLLNIGIENENEIILDFFCGSASVAHAVLELNEDFKKRQFIMVQIPEKIAVESEAYKAGYKTIAEISKDRIRKVIEKIKTQNKATQTLFTNDDQIDLGFKVFKLSKSNFKVWNGNKLTAAELVQQLDAFTNPITDNSLQENILYELLLKSGYSLTEKIILEDNIYIINDGELVVALSLANETIIQRIIDIKPHKLIALDLLFENNDQLKTNTALQLKEAGIDFKTI